MYPSISFISKNNIIFTLLDNFNQQINNYIDINTKVKYSLITGKKIYKGGVYIDCIKNNHELLVIMLTTEKID